MDVLTYLTKRVENDVGRVNRSQYRRDLLKTIILSYPPNTKLSNRELSLALRYDPSSSTFATFRSRLQEAGHIKFTKVDGKNGTYFTYEVLRPPLDYAREAEAIAIDKPTQKEEFIVEDKVLKRYTFKELENLAMKYEFYARGIVERDGYSKPPSVPGFLAWLKEQLNERH